LADLIKYAGLSPSRDILEFIHDLNPYYQPIRYPDSALFQKLVYNRQIARRMIKMTKEVKKWLKW